MGSGAAGAGIGLLAGALARSRQLLPEVLLSTQMQPLEVLYEQLLDGRLDLMLAHAEFRVDLNLVEVTPLYEEHSTILAGVGHRLHKKKKLSWVDLAQEAWVLPPPASSWRSRASSPSPGGCMASGPVL